MRCKRKILLLAMKLNAKKSGMCLILNDDKHKIPWADTEVNVVLMLAISKSDRKMFLDLFDSLTMILTEDENISKLISTSSYKEFKNMLVRLS
ncbi:PTS sugar transporter subunit IIA [Vagococcus acidifermentans]|uniref:PTS EIIA type-2 domain-containing protein n=2 Tax=Vagococcus acidifermentans TaxID=564710 RepID=A0A430AM73_9ENTE|nr:hypothetical protein CBF27_13110 [Vagococcus acidifermentans]